MRAAVSSVLARPRRWIIALATQDNLEDERTSTGGESATSHRKVAFAKGHNRSNREIGKPKQDSLNPARSRVRQSDHARRKQKRRARPRQDLTVVTIPRSEETAMKIVLEFYRVRKADDAHAVVGRETADAADLDDAIGLARQLWRTLDMPQRPDAMSISDNEGNRLYSGTLDTAKNTG